MGLFSSLPPAQAYAPHRRLTQVTENDQPLAIRRSEPAPSAAQIQASPQCKRGMESIAFWRANTRNLGHLAGEPKQVQLHAINDTNNWTMVTLKTTAYLLPNSVARTMATIVAQHFQDDGLNRLSLPS
ncbi:hypothetical protein ColLi_05688 [Colletotrichum liriopes]|uniref:Uncharacterized protein n=1 Tax=Colletotrichum liriopes TaxID=708192 RepID=A0AA37GKY2_9PEZI|nr:hypothetical protein ColLi_05688 [Colletotrichum liriopes]